MVTYKADYYFMLLADCIYFFIFYAIWSNVYLQNGITEIGSYTLSNTITYYFATAIIFRIDVIDAIYLGNEIWNGNFTNDVIKPWNIKGVHVIATLVELLIRVGFYIPVAIVIWLAARNYIVLPNFQTFVLFLITLFFVFALSFSFMMIFQTLYFYFGDQGGLVGLISYIVVFLAGGVFPLTFLGGNLGVLFKALPFRFLFDVPSNIFLGRFSTMEVFGIWGQMVLWTILFWLIFSFLFKKGLKYYTGTGR